MSNAYDVRPHGKDGYLLVRELWRKWLRHMRRASLSVGPLAVVVAVGLAIHTIWFLSHAVSVNGVVVALERADSENGVAYKPVFSFATPNGEPYTVTAVVATNPPGVEVGEHVPVVYNPHDPSQARIKTLWGVWGLSLLLSILGGIFTVLGGVLLLREKRRENREQVTAMD